MKIFPMACMMAHNPTGKITKCAAMLTGVCLQEPVVLLTAIIQSCSFISLPDSGTSFFPKIKWQDALQAPGAIQMQYLKKLILSKSYFDRVPDQSLIIDNGEKYDHILATRGKGYAMCYVYNARDFKVALNKLNFRPAKATWFRAADGQVMAIKNYAYAATKIFSPPGQKANGNDWVLILEK